MLDMLVLLELPKPLLPLLFKRCRLFFTSSSITDSSSSSFSRAYASQNYFTRNRH